MLLDHKIDVQHTRTHARTHAPTHPTHPHTHPSLFLMNIHPPPRRINTFTHPAETDIVNFTPSGKINGMINRSRHTRRKQTLSTLFQQEVTRGPPRLTRSLSADSDISAVHKNPATVTLGANSLTPRGSHGHSRRIQTLQLCIKSLRPSLSADTDSPAYPPAFTLGGNRHVNSAQKLLDAETESPAYPPAFTLGGNRHVNSEHKLLDA